MVKRLKGMGASEQILIDIYQKHLRSVLELAVPAWHGAISQDERNEIERVQKAAHHIVHGGFTKYNLLSKMCLKKTIHQQHMIKDATEEG
jgi:hypothetical protein